MRARLLHAVDLLATRDGPRGEGGADETAVRHAGTSCGTGTWTGGAVMGSSSMVSMVSPMSATTGSLHGHESSVQVQASDAAAYATETSAILIKSFVRLVGIDTLRRWHFTQNVRASFGTQTLRAEFISSLNGHGQLSTMNGRQTKAISQLLMRSRMD